MRMSGDRTVSVRSAGMLTGDIMRKLPTFGRGADERGEVPCLRGA